MPDVQSGIKWWYRFSILLAPTSVVVIVLSAYFSDETVPEVRGGEEEKPVEPYPEAPPVSAIEAVNRSWSQTSLDSREIIDSDVSLGWGWNDGISNVLTLLKSKNDTLPPAYQPIDNPVSAAMNMEMTASFFCIQISNITYSGIDKDSELKVRYDKIIKYYDIGNEPYNFCAEKNTYDVASDKIELVILERSFFNKSVKTNIVTLNRTSIDKDNQRIDFNMLIDGASAALDIKVLPFLPNINSGGDEDSISPSFRQGSFESFGYSDSINYRNGDATDYHRIIARGIYTSLIIWGDAPLIDYLRVTKTNKPDQVVGRIHNYLPVAVVGSAAQESLLMQFQAGRYSQELEYSVMGFTGDKDQRKRLIVEFAGNKLPNLRLNNAPLGQQETKDVLRFLVKNLAVEFTKQDIEAVDNQNLKDLIDVLITDDSYSLGDSDG